MKIVLRQQIKFKLVSFELNIVWQDSVVWDKKTPTVFVGQTTAMLTEEVSNRFPYEIYKFTEAHIDLIVWRIGEAVDTTVSRVNGIRYQ